VGLILSLLHSFGDGRLNKLAALAYAMSPEICCRLFVRSVILFKPLKPVIQSYFILSFAIFTASETPQPH